MNIFVNIFLNFAQAYGAGTYGGDNYGGTTASVGGSSSSASAAQQAHGLANTGFAVIAVLTVACLIIFTAIIVRFWRRKSASSN